MSDKQYLEAVTRFLADIGWQERIAGGSRFNQYRLVLLETTDRLAALKAQEDNIKSDMWEEKKDE